MNTPRIERVRRRMQDYSSLAPAGNQEHPSAIAGWVLRGLAASLRAQKAVLWLSTSQLSEPPTVTVPGHLTARQLQVARMLAQRANSAQASSAPHWAVLVVKNGSAPLAVVALGRPRKEPFSARDRQFLIGLAPMLQAIFSGAMLSGSIATLARAADPTRATMDLLGELAHEMRTPLATIKGHASALLDHRGSWSASRVRETLRIIDEEANTLTTLISELLEGVMIDHGRLAIRPEPVLLNRLIERLVAEFARQTHRHHLTVAFLGRWQVIEADPHRLEQVFRNLLDNAVKYSPKGGLITVTGTASRPEVVVSVADQGVGIAPEDLNQLFEKFFRVRQAVWVAGTGLGLPIARAIVEQHGGRIWAESTLGRGTTVHVALPRKLKRQGIRR
jgi:signal transduction histidine kinase